MIACQDGIVFIGLNKVYDNVFVKICFILFFIFFYSKIEQQNVLSLHLPLNVPNIVKCRIFVCATIFMLCQVEIWGPSCVTCFASTAVVDIL